MEHEETQSEVLFEEVMNATLKMFQKIKNLYVFIIVDYS